MDPFIVKLIITFIVASIWIPTTTLIAERFGTKIGGVLTGLPGTALIALFFIGWTQSPVAAAQATTIMPLAFAGSCAFIALYCAWVKKGFWRAVAIALVAWLLIGYGALSRPLNFKYTLLVFALFLLASYYYLEKVLHLPAPPTKKIKYRPGQILFRALLTGSIITFAVVMAKVGGPLMGGLFASFPAIFLSTMIISYQARGAAFSAALMKVTGLTGSFNVVVYAVAVYYLYPTQGIIYGTLVSFLIALASGYVTYLFAKKKMI